MKGELKTLKSPGADASYCTSSTKCPSGYGDCDNDDDCNSGLVCHQRGANDSPPDGYRFEDVELLEGSLDYCIDESISAPTPQACTAEVPCGNGEGGCNSDAECAIDLVCYEREAGDDPPTGYQFSAFDINGDISGSTNYCITGMTLKSIGVEECASSDCDEGEGDCDSNSECKTGLYCFNRDAGNFPPVGYRFSAEDVSRG